MNEYEQIGTMGNPTNNNNFECNNVLTSPANGDDDEFGDSALDEVFGPTGPIGIP